MHKPSVLVVHNHYQQPGGEDTAVQAEIELLRTRGHRVMRYMRHNTEIANYSILRKSSLLFSTSWNQNTYARIRDLVARHKPDVAHFHNFLPLVSPAAYYACKAAGIAVVQTLHNYRLICPAGTLFREGRPCSRCAGRSSNAVLHGCYRNSRLQTAAVSAMLQAHQFAGTWRESVSAYITPSRFCRDAFIGSGLPAHKIFCRPNFLTLDPGRGSEPGSYALFVGRLSPEKGVVEMLQAWRKLPEVPLAVVGDGPLYSRLWQDIQDGDLNVKLLGQVDRTQTLELMKGARFLVFPSLWHEPFGMALVEAAACGVPAIAFRVGAVPEIIADRRTGMLVDNFDQFADCVRWAWLHPEQMEAMGDAARQRYLHTYTAEASYRSLLDIYNRVLTN